ncbi:MAG TPA: ketoacyl-ACP synthase III [Bryobacteraceae bacterium]|nr:ketoacyl-ACP synthase III [Bryobacteraceae bacterium]
MQAAIRAIEYQLGGRKVSNEDLAVEFPEWSIAKIEQKTGIADRWIAGAEESAGDLACQAARKLFQSGAAAPADIDFVLLCTQSPDYLLPTTACVIQDRLGIPQSAGALDFNLGCSGFVYGLGLAKGLIETGQARNVLLLTSETYSKYIAADDRSVRTIFSDGAAATLVGGVERQTPTLGPFVYGTDGRGAENLMVAGGGSRNPAGERSLFMNGPEIFAFTLEAVPNAVRSLLARTGRSVADIDLFVFHQANAYMLNHLRQKLAIPSEKFYLYMRHVGNTVSATIPIALKHACQEDRIHPGDQVMLVGFGVGYSWAATMATWA